MATYIPVPSTVPSQHRSARITAVIATDRIDIAAILGRPARGLKFVTGLTTDVITFKLNNLLKIQTKDSTLLYPPVQEPVEVWSGSPGYNIFSVTGALEHTTEDGVKISSVEIMTSTDTIEIVVW